MRRSLESIVFIFLLSVLCVVCSYDLKLLQYAAHLNVEVNCPWSEHSFRYGFTYIENFSWGFIGHSAQFSSIIAVFKRRFVSNPLTPVVTVLDTTLIPFDRCPNCMINKLFYRYEQENIHSIRDQLNILRTLYPTSKIILTGFSTGGAIATVAAVELLHNNSLSNATLITFGAPRVGNAEFAIHASSSHNFTIHRVTYGRDPVPHYPVEHTYSHTTGE